MNQLKQKKAEQKEVFNRAFEQIQEFRKSFSNADNAISLEERVSAVEEVILDILSGGIKE